MNNTHACVDADAFYRRVGELKLSGKVKSKTKTFVDDGFYDQAANWLQTTEQERKQLDIQEPDQQAIKRKIWRLHEGCILNKANKRVIPRRELHQTLSEVHKAIAHRGRGKTETYIRERNLEISQCVIEVFVSNCKLHQQQKGVIDHQKKAVLHPLQGNNFLAHVVIDLIDFRNLPCNCRRTNQWLLHVIDHFSKFTWLFPLKRKKTNEVVQALEKLFWSIGFPATLHSDNGGEFKSQMMSDFCQRHHIRQVHGAPRNTSTQGLVERNNRTVKENMSNILEEQKKDFREWCQILDETAYKKNISYHRAIKTSPYQVVFGITPHKERNIRNVAEVEDSDRENFTA